MALFKAPVVPQILNSVPYHLALNYVPYALALSFLKVTNGTLKPVKMLNKYFWNE